MSSKKQQTKTTRDQEEEDESSNDGEYDEEDGEGNGNGSNGSDGNSFARRPAFGGRGGGRPSTTWAAPHFVDQAPALAPSPLFTVDLNRSIGSEYAGLIEDVLRMVSLQFTIQVMLYFGNATERMFTEELFVLLFYIVLGVAFYWLFVRTLVTFR